MFRPVIPDADNAVVGSQYYTYEIKHRILFAVLFYRRNAFDCLVRRKRGKKMKETTKRTTVKLTVSAMLIAMSTVLSMIKPIDLPFGGSVTPLSMLPVMLIPLMYGAGWGFFACFTNSVIQMFLSLAEVLTWGMTPVTLVACILLDYILAYTVLGVIGFFRKGNNAVIIVGAIVALFGRLLMHFISGCVLFGEFDAGFFTGLWAALSYNLSYMVPEMITTSIVLAFLLKNKAFSRLIRQ